MENRPAPECATLRLADAVNLLKDKVVFFCGDSILRAIYKDVVWLLEEGTLIPSLSLKTKNEISHAGDNRLSNGSVHSGRHYIEVRQYNRRAEVHFYFITRIYDESLFSEIGEVQPDFILINSCVWDLTRWGPNRVAEYKDNVRKTCARLCKVAPRSHIIFVTTPPISFDAHGGFLIEEIVFTRTMLPWQILEANNFLATVTKDHKCDVIDLHYYMKGLLNLWTLYGIHWLPPAVRYSTNLILTHISLVTNTCLPNHSVN